MMILSLIYIYAHTHTHPTVRVICHPTTGKSKGFGFVKFSSENQAAAALQKMNGQASVSSLSSFIHHSYIVWSMYL